MKYWVIKKKNKISLDERPGTNDFWPRVFSIKKEGDKIRFREECDGYFFVQMTKQEAIDALQEGIDWIKEG